MGEPGTLTDPFGRRIDYLRVSVTDRCNFRCVYCMPEQGFPATPKEECLTLDETARLVRVAVSLGITKVRLTGGEPLLLNGLPDLVRQIAALPGVTDLSVTTNGHLLEERAEALKEAGLTRLNVSLDTLRPDRFREIARRGDFDKVMRGIDFALASGLRPLKINCVLMRGVNDDEVADFARWTQSAPVHVRFIELMPMRWHLDDGPALPSLPAGAHHGLLQLRQTQGDMLSDVQMRRMTMTAAEARSAIEKDLGEMEPTEIPTNGPARTFRLPDAPGTVGFISQISNDFCSRCNRVRLTHDGFLRPCLMSDGEADLRTPLRMGASDWELAEIYRGVVDQKPERHYLAEGQVVSGRGMSQIGG